MSHVLAVPDAINVNDGMDGAACMCFWEPCLSTNVSTGRYTVVYKASSFLWPGWSRTYNEAISTSE